MVNVFGSTGEEGSLGNIQAVRKLLAISGRYSDYFIEIQASHELGYPAYLKALQPLYLHLRSRYFAWNNFKRCNESALPRILERR